MKSKYHQHYCPILKSPFFPFLQNRLLQEYQEESWDGLVERMLALTIEAESKYTHANTERSSYIKDIHEYLNNGLFLPNSPLMVHSGKVPEQRKLFACFSLDSRMPEDDFLKISRDIHDGMGGIGYTFDQNKSTSIIRQFIQRFDTDTVSHQSGRPRPASNAATISVHHQGIEGLLSLAGHTKVTNLNVAIDDDFMQQIQAKDSKAWLLYQKIIQSIHATGQPGIIFSQKIPKISNQSDALYAANVCGEAPLAGNESGLLGSIHLPLCLIKKDDGSFQIDWTKLERVVICATRYLDGMHDLHHHTNSQVRENSQATRKIGVGIMGFAHLLSLLQVRYGSQQSIAIAQKIGQMLMRASQRESERLGKVRGTFPAYHTGLGFKPRRNAVLVAIAQTSTLSLLCHTSSGIEPIYSHLTKQRILGENRYILDHIVGYFSEQAGIPIDKCIQRLEAGDTLVEIIGEISRYIPTALEISPKDQIAVQGAFQREIDGGISKTVNCCTETALEDIEHLIQLGCPREKLDTC
jgi:ribonucleoside-diphosphate reductase alpha chain